MSRMTQPVADTSAGRGPDVTVRPETAPRVSLTLSCLLSSLSRALDLTEGQPMGHAVKTCLIGLRIGTALGVPDDMLASLHLALLLKDAGCSSNAARMFAVFGCDDQEAKQDAKIRDWCRLTEAVKYAVRHTAPTAPFPERLRRLRELTRMPGRVMDALTEARCTRGAGIARQLGLDPLAAEAIYCLDEHWDGRGAPLGRAGQEIPLLARLGGLAQTIEVFATTFGPAEAFAVARRRAGQWFDPMLVRASEPLEHDARFWEALNAFPLRLLEEWTGDLLRDRLSDADVDNVCDAFASIVDAKSSFTAEHSSRVSDIAVQTGCRLGFPAERLVELRRAGLLHDLGKLAVPNLILDKPGALTGEEFAVIQRHPFYTEQVLMNIPSFARITEVAAAHHEKLDGSGYFRGLSAPDLDFDMRVLAAADMYDALTADRPYRPAMPREQALALLEKEARHGRMDPDCIAALPEE